MKNERVRDILRAALEEFAERGFAAARLDSIAERAGVAKGTIYLHFDNKETLFEEAVRAEIGPVIARLEAMADEPGPSAEAVLSEMMRSFYREVISDPKKRGLIRLIISDGPRFKGLLRFYHAEVVSRGMAALKAVVTHGVARGEFRETAVSDYPQILFGPALLSAIWTILFEDIDPLDFERFSEAHLAFALDGLRETR